ncbi:MAG TPA: hypothetical protein PKK94_10815, partial [Leptospiraceae bacterium]|nr:hypothetical protein [Leptospiraceae bacterium]
MLKPELWVLDIDPDAADAEAQIQPWRGMVRASLGLYSTEDDIDALLTGVRDVRDQAEYYRAQYLADRAG